MRLMKNGAQISWQYIAGFVDGEGSIVKTKRTVYRILIPQTHEGVLKAIQGFTGMGFIFKGKTRKAHWKDNWVYVVAQQRQVLFFLKKIHPYLIVKRQLATDRIPVLTQLIFEGDQRRGQLQKRLKLCKFWRSKGLTYRAIGKKLKIDFGYARRLCLYA